MKKKGSKKGSKRGQKPGFWPLFYGRGRSKWSKEGSHRIDFWPFLTDFCQFFPPDLFKKGVKIPLRARVVRVIEILKKRSFFETFFSKSEKKRGHFWPLFWPFFCPSFWPHIFGVFYKYLIFTYIITTCIFLTWIINESKMGRKKGFLTH